MRRLSRPQIRLEARQRSGELSSYRDLELKNSILSKGLLHPPVVQFDGAKGDYVLVAGGRRLAAIDWIAEDQGYFLCDGETVLPGEVPALIISEDLSALTRMEAEFEENYIRLDPPWQDRVRALAAIHSARVAANPLHTAADTGREIAASGGIAGSTAVPNTISKQVIAATLVAEHLHDPAIRNARNANEAHQLTIDRIERAFLAENIRRREATARLSQSPNGTRERAGELPPDPPHRIICGDATLLLPTLPDNVYDLVLADPPYAIGAGSAGFRSRTIHHHNYTDDPAATKQFLQFLLGESFRLTKTRANLFLFTDIDLFEWLKLSASAAGWSVFRTPIIWRKSESEGLAPWGRQGFRRTFEMILFATKGGKGLLTSPLDILDFSRVSRAVRDYGAQKPVELMKLLIEVSTLPGDSVLDPCCGSGATVLAAKSCLRKALGIDLDKAATDAALIKLNALEMPAPIEAPEVEPMETMPDVSAL